MKISKKTILCAALAVTIVTFTIGGLFTLWWFSVPNAQLLVNAAGNDDLDKVKQLVAKGTDPNAQEPGMLGDTPLVASTLAEGTNVFFFLLSAGAKVDTRDQMGNTPLMMSVTLGDVNFVKTKALIDAGADVNAVNRGIRALRNAQLAGQGGHIVVNTIELLKQHGAKE